MISINELRVKCQADKEKYDTWYGRYFARKVSIYLTFLFLKLGIKANAVTGISLLSGIVSGVVLAIGGRGSVLAGVLILQLWYILDHVDGEIARYNDETSLTGVYYDYVTHYIVHSVVFLGIGWGFFRTFENMMYLMAGVSGALGVILFSLIIDLKDLVVYRDRKACSGGDVVGQIRFRRSPASLPFKMFSKVYLFCTFPFVMNVITGFAIMDFVFKLSYTGFVLIFYAILINIVWMLRMSVFITQRRIDKEAADVR